jgi:beta-galactosidase
VDALGLPTFSCDPSTVFVTVHEDEAGIPRVAFVMNPEDEEVLATVGVGSEARALVDLLPQTLQPARIELQSGGFVVPMQPRSVRMFGIET